MSDELAYVGRNLNSRTISAVQKFQVEVSRVQREAAAAGALHSSRTFMNFWEAGIRLLDEEVKSAMEFAFNATGRHTGEVYEQVAFCANQMAVRMIQEVKNRAATNESTFGGGYSEIVDRMQVAMHEKKDQVLDDFQHGMMGSERLKRDPLVSVVNNQTNSPGAVQQVGTGNFNQTAFNQNHQSLVTEIDKALASPEFKDLAQDQKDAFRDVADVVRVEAEKPVPDEGKLKRWGKRLVDISSDIGLKVVSGAIAGVLTKMYIGP
ncbi:hypothetical protein [Tardiphaga sp.]|uniref:hypothetical protein n=1 Tax=Tardiphaga sp. TaxID=1926292 RepID=UPI0037D9B2FF